MMPSVYIKRAYEKYLKEDGTRILVDRLWPRGITKEKAHVDYWARDLAPTSELRKWFGHDAERWPEFKKEYKKELKKNKAVSDFIKKYKSEKIITLVYGAKDELHTHALVLKSYLEGCFADK